MISFCCLLFIIAFAFGYYYRSREEKIKKNRFENKIIDVENNNYNHNFIDNIPTIRPKDLKKNMPPL